MCWVAGLFGPEGLVVAVGGREGGPPLTAGVGAEHPDMDTLHPP